MDCFYDIAILFNVRRTLGLTLEKIIQALNNNYELTISLMYWGLR